MLAREMESDYSRVGASGNRSRVSHAAAPVLIGAALLLGLASVGIMRQQVVAALHSPAQCNVRDTTRCEHVNAVCAQAALSSLQEQLAEQLRAQQTLLSASMSASHKKEAAPWAKFLPPSMKEKEEERMEEILPLMSKLPAKYVIPYVTPSSDQANRGDCWLFATAGILESSYIHYGVCSRPTTEACTRRSTLAQSHLPRPPRPATLGDHQARPTATWTAPSSSG